VLSTNGIQIKNVIAVVTDNASNMDRMRRLLNEEYPNIIPIRCCLHVFNLIVKDISSFPSVIAICKKNQKLVNFFNSSHIWHRELQNWKEKKGITHFLSTFCETRWFSLAKVCMGVSTYEEGFRHCLSLSETARPKYPEIEKYIVDAIRKLESNNSSLADVFKELIFLHQQISRLEIPINGFQAHTLAVINKRAKEFNSDIYFVALFFSPTHMRLAISKIMDEEAIIRASLELAKVWKFNQRDTGLLSEFKGNSPLLRQFAMKLLSIVPHGATCERLFSSLGLVKSKMRSKITPDNLSILGQLKSELQKKISTKAKKRSETISEPLIEEDRNLENLFEEEIDQLEELNEELNEITTEQ
ncbi:14122_t:CDS:2, partial [Cetraspora pellucida]